MAAVVFREESVLTVKLQTLSSRRLRVSVAPANTCCLQASRKKLKLAAGKPGITATEAYAGF